MCTIFRETAYGTSDVVKHYDDPKEAEKRLIELIDSSDHNKFVSYTLRFDD
jgi:hypothetical protein